MLARYVELAEEVFGGERAGQIEQLLLLLVQLLENLAFGLRGCVLPALLLPLHQRLHVDVLADGLLDDLLLLALPLAELLLVDRVVVDGALGRDQVQQQVVVLAVGQLAGPVGPQVGAPDAVPALQQRLLLLRGRGLLAEQLDEVRLLRGGGRLLGLSWEGEHDQQ